MKNREELIKEVTVDLLKLMGGIIDKVRYDNLSLGIAEHALNAMGYYNDGDYNTNGWEVDYWCKFVYTPDKNDILQVSGSMYHGHLTISINE